jgi:anion-transporting  ArsA/GET3 family ATPase
VSEELSQLRENLWGVNTNPTAALHEYGLMVLRYETVYRLVMENQVARRLLRAVPGLDDYSIVGKMWFHTTEELPSGQPRWDTIVFDAPATGHARTMFKIPRAILEAVPQGPLTRDATKVQALLEDPARTAVILVTLAEEMPANEAIELAAKLKDDLRMPLTHVIVNQLWPDRFQSGTPTRVLDALIGENGAADDPALAPLVAGARTARSRRQVNDRYLTRLTQQIAAPQIRLPLLFTPTLGPKELATLQDELEAQLAAPAAARRAP